jgi:hypothetical protein
MRAMQSTLDVLTPEQAASGDYDDTGRRKFRLHMIDRLHRNNKLTYEQHAAGSWYRDQWDRGRYDNPRTSDPGRARGSNVLSFIPVNQQRARDNWLEARTKWPTGMLGFMERLILRNELPKRHHRAMARDLAAIRAALDAMVKHLRY